MTNSKTYRATRAKLSKQTIIHIHNELAMLQQLKLNNYPADIIQAKKYRVQGALELALVQGVISLDEYATYVSMVK